MKEYKNLANFHRLKSALIRVVPKVRNLQFFLVLFITLASCGSSDKPKPVSVKNKTTLDSNTWKREEKLLGFTYDRNTLHYELVWSDEFEYEGTPDPTKWSCETGGHGWGNNELQYYTDGANVRVENGRMIIEARHETIGNRNVSSTRLITKNKGDWLYGKVEVSAKLPRGLGTWPAIWMLPTDWVYGNWPLSGEIDIMEHVGYDQDTIHTTVHTGAFNHTKGTQKGKSMHYEKVDTEFHCYAIEWLPDKIYFFVDGKEQFVFNPLDYVSAASYQHWPFDKRFHLLINLAFGGNWGGAKGVDYNALPAQMEIEYVRVYQSLEINAFQKSK